jgi:hypothetical protein
MRVKLRALLAALFFAGAAAVGEELLDTDALAWRERLAAERAVLEEAKERVANAQQALGDARQRRHPRGDQLGKLYAELEAAQADLAAHQKAWPDLLEEARQAGAPPVVLREFEDDAPREPQPPANASPPVP